MGLIRVAVWCATVMALLPLSVAAQVRDALLPGGAPPGMTASVFAAGMVSSGAQEHGITVNEDCDTVLLNEMIRRIRDGEYQNIHSVLVLNGDSLVLEEYFGAYDADTPHQLRSATKAIGSILVGIAIDRGIVTSEEAPVYEYFKEDYEPTYGWTDRARSVRIRDLLSMTSGYDCDDLATPAFACEHAMYETDDWVQYSLDLPIVHARGEHWAYNSSSLILAGEAIARSSGMPLEEFADAYLFGRLGIERFQWAVSPQGRAWIGGGARMVPVDMAKIGQLMLNGGVWEGRRLLSERWIEMSTRPQAEYHAGVDYGFIWQLGQFFLGGELIPAYWASGNGGQYIVVFPAHDLVVVFTGGNYDSPLAGQPFQLLDRYILPALLHPPSDPSAVLAANQLERLTGTYHLDFEPAATCSVEVHAKGLRMLTPDQEYVELRSHSPYWFSGDSQWGRITVVFDEDGADQVARLTVYGAGSRFVFQRSGDRRP